MLPKWLTWNALLVSLPHHRRTTISVPLLFFFFSRQEEKDINTGEWKAQIGAVSVLIGNAITSHVQPFGGAHATVGGFPRVCTREAQVA